MHAYHLEITHLDFALILFVDGEERQVFSGEPESLREIAGSLSCPVTQLTSEDALRVRHWIDQETGERLGADLYTRAHN